MSLTYTTWQTAILNTVAGSSLDLDWALALPQFIDYAEQRMYRELDLLTCRVNLTSTMIGSSAINTIPLGNGLVNGVIAVSTNSIASIYGVFFIVLDSVGLITPPSSAGAVFPNTGVLPLSRVSDDLLRTMWGAATYGPPEMWALEDNMTVTLGPIPDLGYNFLLRGTARPTPLSSANTNTYLTQYLPDAFFCATMISAAGYMRNFGEQADNPQMAQSWENQYKLLMTSAKIEEVRKYARAQGWQMFDPGAQGVTPARN